MESEEPQPSAAAFTELEQLNGQKEPVDSKMEDGGQPGIYTAVELSTAPDLKTNQDAANGNGAGHTKEDGSVATDPLSRGPSPEFLDENAQKASANGSHTPDANGGSHMAVTAVSNEATPEARPIAEQGSAALLRALYLFLALLIPAAFFMFAFTEMGFGATVFKLLAGNSSASAAAGAGMFLFCILYLLDVFWWQGPALRVLRAVLLSFCGVCILIAVCLTFRTRPYAPILGFLVVFTFYCVLIFWRFFAHKAHVVNFMHSLSMALIAIGVIGLVWGLVWAASEDFWWGEESRLEFQNRLRVCEDMETGAGKHCVSYGVGGNGVSCPPGCVEKKDESACDPDSQHCLAAFLLWGSQFIASTLILVIAGSMFFISKSLIAHEGDAKASPTAKLYGYGVLVFVFLIWVASSIGGASMQLSNMVSAFAITGLALLLCLIGVSIGRSGLSKMAQSDKAKKLLAVTQSDWVKAMGMITVAFLAPLILFISFLNQILRKSCLGFFMKQMTEEEKKGILTPYGMKMLKAAKNWNWSSVLRKAILLGFAYFVLQVGVGKITTIFLAWLNLKLASVNIWALSVIIFFVGMALFLIPAVPGLPVYVTNGVTLGAAGEREWGDFWVAMAWGIVVASITKLAACWFQQKIIGERMGDWISVRATVGVNSSSVKAIRLILRRPGMDRDKVFILIGGPDWPTSVLTGILKLSYINMMTGTLPILIPIALTVIAGGCVLKSSEGGIWESISGLFLTLSAGTFGGALIAAAVAIERCATQNKEELAAIPDDEEVKAYDQAQVEKDLRFKAATEWSKVPLFGRVALFISWFAMYLSVIAFAQFGTECFENVELTDDYRNPPLNGDVLNVLKMPAGGGALALHGVSLVIYYLFGVWAKAASRHVVLEPAATDTEGGGSSKAPDAAIAADTTAVAGLGAAVVVG